MDMNLSKFWEMVEDRGSWCATAHGISKSEKQRSDWTTITDGWIILCCIYVPPLLYGYLICFHIAATVYSAAVNTGACIFSSYCFLRIYAQEWDSWLYSSIFYFFKEPPYCSTWWLYPIYIPTNSVGGFLTGLTSRNARGHQEAGGNKMQVTDFFFSLHFSVENSWFFLNLIFLKQWANQCIFLTEMFFWNCVNETVYLLWNLLLLLLSRFSRVRLCATP